MTYRVILARYDGMDRHTVETDLLSMNAARMMAYCWLSHDTIINSKGEVKALIYNDGKFIGEMQNTAGDIRYWYPEKYTKTGKGFRKYTVRANGKITEGSW